MNPFRSLQSMRPTLLLMGGRTVGFVVAFAIPMVLTRVLNQYEYGTYRLLFLLYTTILLLAQFGMAESLYYFVPQQPARAGRWTANAVTTLAVVGAAGAGLIWLLAPVIGGRFNNPLLVRELPKMGIFLALTLASAGFEIVMVCRKQYRGAAMAYAGSDITRGVLLTIPALLTHSVDALMLGAIVFATLRCTVTGVYLAREFKDQLRLDRGLWRQQLAYALPFAATVVVEQAQTNYHQYAVALWFDPATFAIYSIGCLQIPLVDLLANSANNVMMVSMSDHIANGQSPLPLWHETVERLACILFPMVGVLLLVGRDLLVLLYTDKYAASVPIFLMSTLLILLSAFPVDSVLRVYAEMRTLLLLYIVRLVFIAASIGWFVSTFHLQGAVLVTLSAALLAKVIGIARVGHLMRAGARDVLPWRSLAGVTAAAAVALVPGWLTHSYLSAPFVVVALAAGAAYGVTYLALISGAWLLQTGGRTATEPA